MGPLDASTVSASIYSGTTGIISGGVERTFTGSAATNFGFVPTLIVLTGRSNWTGFANEDFSGNSTCFTSTNIMENVYLDGIEVRSLVKGCDAMYGSVYYDANKSMGLENVGD